MILYDNGTTDRDISEGTYGDAKFSPSGKGNLAVPTSRTRKEVGIHLNTVGIDEYNSSKKCCCGHSKLGFGLNSKTGFQSWKFRICNNALCPRKYHDRNTSACINMLYCFFSQVADQGRPATFKRPVSTFFDSLNVPVVLIDDDDDSLNVPVVLIDDDDDDGEDDEDLV